MIKQIGLPLRGRPILLITRMITDRIGLHSVLLPLHKICPMLYFCNCICNCLGSFHSTKIPVRNFGNSTSVPNGTVHSGCTDPNQGTARLVIVLNVLTIFMPLPSASTRHYTITKQFIQLCKVYNSHLFVISQTCF